MNHSLENYTSRKLIVTRWLDDLASAYQLMNQHKLRHLPVIDDGQKIIGIISDRDFQRAMQPEQTDFSHGYQMRPRFPATAKVRDVMSWPVKGIDEKSSIAEAAEMMIDQKISALLVTRERNVVGIVTTEDLLRSLISDSQVSAGMTSDFRAALYNSPVGQIAQTLANAGV